MEISHESIFVSSLRSLCRAFCSLVGIFLALFILFLVYSMFSSPYEPEEKTQLEILPNLNNSLTVQPYSAPVVLQINVSGVIGEPSLDTKTIEHILIDSRHGFFQNNRVKAILLYINTPGGTALDSDNIYRMLKAYKEQYQTPIFAYVNGLCASGGMYIASSADRTYASPESIIGSVGVRFGPLFNVYEALDRLGVQSQTLIAGKDKDEMNPFRPWKPDEAESFQTLIDASYERFVNIVTQSHPRLDRDRLINEYGAKIFDSTVAQELGYIDVAGAEYKMALQDLLSAAGLDASRPYQVVTLEPRRDLSSLLINRSSLLVTGKVQHEINFGDNLSSATRNQVCYLYVPGAAEQRSMSAP